ncbi:MAG: hypothetical protein ABSB77_25940 [Xanthobacteraceae bacterium]|jgi:phosphatidylserine/phosphatidylglycerophosphate/cardiolipin synthase-like enzyme
MTIHSLPPTPRWICLLATLCALAGAVGRAGANDDDDLVPPSELLDQLKAYQMYLLDAKGTKPVDKDPSPVDGLRQVTPQLRPELVKEAVAAGMTQAQARSVLGVIPIRGERAVEDFYDANLAPLQASVFNIETLELPVKRADWNKLVTAMEELKKFEDKLRTMRKVEQDLQKDEAEVLEKIMAVHRKALDIRSKYEPLLAAQPGNYAALSAEYEKTLAAEVTPLRDLYDKWKDKDKHDQALVNLYERKIFTFEIPPTYTGKNSVKPLIDGHAVYGRIDELLNDVAANANGKGYVHISLWWCQFDTQLTGRERFIAAIKNVVAAGDEVAVSLWEGSKVFPDVTKDNLKCKAELERIGARVQLQVHGDVIGSYHEKFFVFFNGTQVRAIVGGLNVDKASYSVSPHRGSNGDWQDVHDVAVELTGPATSDVEDDFTTRWLSESRTTVLGPTPPSPVGGSDEVRIALTRPSLRKVGSGRAEDIERLQPLLSSKRQTILAELLQRINAAETFIYLENYAVFEEKIIRAIGQRITAEKNRGRSIEVLILVHKANIETHKDQSVYGWLHWITYLHLSFMRCDSFSYTDEDGRPHFVTRKTSGNIKWEVGPYEGDYYQDTKVSWDDGSTKLTSIAHFGGEGFGGDVPLYTLVYHSGGGRPDVPIWVHSKVSIFDDAYAGIGSANFNARSLHYDGELTAFFHGASVAQFRTDLWKEYWRAHVPTIASWDDDAENNKKTLATLPGGSSYVLPLHWEDFNHRKPVRESRLEDILVGAEWY